MTCYLCRHIFHVHSSAQALKITLILKKQLTVSIFIRCFLSPLDVRQHHISLMYGSLLRRVSAKKYSKLQKRYHRKTKKKKKKNEKRQIGISLSDKPNEFIASVRTWTSYLPLGIRSPPSELQITAYK